MKRAAKQVIKKLEEYKQEKVTQMELFQLVTTEGQEYSNTIELYDFIPKYHWGNVTRLNDQFLESLERTFVYRGREYTAIIAPARIKDKDGVVRDYFPSQREELVEDALRKLACEGRGLMLDDEAGVVFTLYELQKELESKGHGYNTNEIKEALLICARTHIELRAEGEGGKLKTELESNVFETVGLQTREDWKGHGEKSKAFVRFNFLVTRSIKNGTFRPINYEKGMSFKSVIARQLFKRLSHNYTQASLEKKDKYSILLSTLIRDFGLSTNQPLRVSWQQVKAALEKLEEADVILSFERTPVSDPKRKGKIADAKITITPHPRFISEMKKYNNISRQVRSGLPDAILAEQHEQTRAAAIAQALGRINSSKP
jgi:hypothetical protein